MKAIFVISLLLGTAFYETNAQLSCPGMACLHSGYLDVTDCKCDCLAPYSGDYCERAINNCQTNQPSECNTYITPDFCSFSIFVINYCPAMCNSKVCECGLSECLNGGIFDRNTCTCKCPDHYSGEVCQRYSKCAKWLTCENYGEFNEDTCTCNCISKTFGGDSCELTKCGEPEDPEYCTYFHADKYCDPTGVVYDFCPYLCGQCVKTTKGTTKVTTEATTVATTELTTKATTEITTEATTEVQTVYPTDSYNVTDLPTDSYNATVYPTDSYNVTDLPTEEPTTETITSCSPLDCQSGVIFDTVSCSCPCTTGFYGTLCESFDCSHTELDLPYCSTLPCTDPAIFGACPYKCHCLV